MAKYEQLLNETKETRKELDNIRRELDAKINNKISSANFYSGLGVVSAVLIAVFGFTFNKVVEFEHRLTINETKVSEREIK